jgi:exodeoxyribonuclease VII small subunit
MEEELEESAQPPEEKDNHASDLSFNQAQAALELCLVELQSNQLDVEQMMELYRRALSYADRCESLLDSVEQEVLQWDASEPDAPPLPFEP